MNLTCYYRGVIYKAGLKAGEESIVELLNEYCLSKHINTTYFMGSYWIVIIDETNDLVIFFGDNSGSCSFYFDTNTNIFSDSFLDITKQSNQLLPNFDAITQFLSFNCIYSEDTICKGIHRTNPSNYYVIENDSIKVKEKEFLKLDENCKYTNLSEYFDDFIYATQDFRKAAVITGGTDSRTILSHLIYKNENFDLFISGCDEMKDVKIAKEISKRISKYLHVSNESINNLNEEELRALFESTDGVYSYVSRFRLHKKNEMLVKIGTDIEVGGVAGELYKNSFLNQDFPFYMCKRFNKNKFYNVKMNPEKLEKSLFTREINNAQNIMKERILNNIFGKTSGKKHQVYFKAGVKVLQYRMNTITNSSSFTIPILSPFAEIDVMPLAYNEKPWNLELNRWQRHEVSRYCPQIASIPTDRGTTLKDKKMSMLKEFLRTYLFLFRMGISRVLKFKKRILIRNINNDFSKIREMEIFNIAIDTTREIGILNENVNSEDIPDSIADKLLTIALVFDADSIWGNLSAY
jgi:hypothetical protein